MSIGPQWSRAVVGSEPVSCVRACDGNVIVLMGMICNRVGSSGRTESAGLFTVVGRETGAPVVIISPSSPCIADVCCMAHGRLCQVCVCVPPSLTRPRLRHASLK
jgi:hypothetical protein